MTYNCSLEIDSDVRATVRESSTVRNSRRKRMQYATVNIPTNSGDDHKEGAPDVSDGMAIAKDQSGEFCEICPPICSREP